MTTVNDELLEHRLRGRLHEAEKALRELKRIYKGDESYYRDQIAYVASLREWLEVLP